MYRGHSRVLRKGPGEVASRLPAVTGAAQVCIPHAASHGVPPSMPEDLAEGKHCVFK